MTQVSEETHTICVFGIAGRECAVELYGVNAAREVTVHGWFQLIECFLVLAGRPRCLIAIDAGALPIEFIRELLRMGHGVVIMPSHRSAGRAQYRRTARDICHLAAGISDGDGQDEPTLQ